MQPRCDGAYEYTFKVCDICGDRILEEQLEETPEAPLVVHVDGLGVEKDLADDIRKKRADSQNKAQEEAQKILPGLAFLTDELDVADRNDDGGNNDYGPGKEHERLRAARPPVKMHR